jgi:hypothetical protein
VLVKIAMIKVDRGQCDMHERRAEPETGRERE